MDIPSPLLSGAIGAPAGASDATKAPNAAAADFNNFLNLLTAQLRNQDPLSPLDATEFVAQLASFSSVEQLISANARLEGLAGQLSAGSVAGLAGWIGRDAATAGGTFRATGGAVQLIAPPAASGEHIEAAIRTPAGTLIRRLAVADGPDGSMQWDGRDLNGNLLAPQDLVLEFIRTRDDGTKETVPGEALTRVTAIRGGPNGVLVDLADGRSVAPESLSRIQEPAAAG